MTDPKSAGDGGEVKRWDFAEAEDSPLWRFDNGRFVRYDDHAAALAEAKQEAADNEADYQGLARLIEEAGYPHLRAMIQALEEAKEFSRRDNQMAAMAEIKIAEARKRAKAAQARVAELEAEVERLRDDLHIQYERGKQQEQVIESAQARVAELEQIHSEVMLEGEAETIRRLEARVAELEAEVDRRGEAWREAIEAGVLQMRKREAAEARVAELIGERDEAYRQRAEALQYRDRECARADRLAEVLQRTTGRACECWKYGHAAKCVSCEAREALDAAREGENDEN